MDSRLNSIGLIILAIAIAMNGYCSSKADKVLGGMIMAVNEKTNILAKSHGVTLKE